ncbi:hypothetical protein [Palleronia pelagia]|uniref:MarR family protein n=1 Tax=Palleronia pelagia TaxID=387096 RepID=A0A1H8J570_9RHOB|nr:hypothetical protein [Palleronia pelagia]SEN76083.1 hypothetical protein SAMN04488011_10683 [Palleronia pelagia]
MTNTAALSELAELRVALHQMEATLGLNDMTRNERDVLCAFQYAGAEDGPVSSESAKSSDLLSSVSHATFHRSLRSLLEKGYVQLAPDHRAKHYVIPSRALPWEA